MDFLKHTASWVQGEVTQGKVMTLLGIILLICCFFIWRNGSDILKGALVPLLLVVVILMGYGIFQIIARPGHLTTITINYQENPQEAIVKEKGRVYKDKNAYTKFKIAWAFLMIAGLIFYFLTGKLYYKGLALGILFLSISALIIDTIMQQRSIEYHQNITSSE